MRKYITLPFEEYAKMKNRDKDSSSSKLTTSYSDHGSTVGDDRTVEEVARKDLKSPSSDETPTAEPSEVPLEQRPASHPHYTKSGLIHKSEKIPGIPNQKGKGRLNQQELQAISSSETSNLSTPPGSSVQRHVISQKEGSQSDSPNRSPVYESQGVENDQRGGHHKILDPHTRRRWRRPGDERKLLSQASEDQEATQATHSQTVHPDDSQIDHPVGKKGSPVQYAGKDETNTATGWVEPVHQKSSEEQDAKLEKAPSVKVVNPAANSLKRTGEWGSLWNGPNLRKRVRHQDSTDPVQDAPSSREQMEAPVSPSLQSAQQKVEWPGHDSVSPEIEDVHHTLVTRHPDRKKKGSPLVDQESDLSRLSLSAPLPPPGVPPEKTKNNVKTFISQDISKQNKAGISKHINITRHNNRPKRSNAGTHSEGWRNDWKS